MARTDALKVRGVLRDGSKGGDYDDANMPSLTRYISLANLTTTRVNVCAGNRGVTLSAEELLELETLLAAHAYACSDQTYQSKSTGGASGSHHGQTGMKLESTRYGQLALTFADALNIAGCLLPNKAGAFWNGRPPSAQTAYVDRD